METDGELPEDPTPPFEEASTATSRTRWWIVAAVLAVLVVVAGGALWLTRGDEVPPTSTTTSTTSSTTTTTSEPDRLVAGEVEIATAKDTVSKVLISSTAPEGWDDLPDALVYDPPAPRPPASAETAPERPPLPGLNEPIVGRTATPDGWVFDNPGPYIPRQPFTMVVTARRGDWAKVQFPVRPNGTEGWVSLDQVELSIIETRIDVNLTDRTLKAYEGDTVVAETPVVIGVEFSPTPTGAFFVTDVVPQTSPSFGPFALATNAYSELLNEFDTGVPVVAIHGTDNPDVMGQARSNGCIRVPNDIIEVLAEQMPLGTPVYIWP